MSLTDDGLRPFATVVAVFAVIGVGIGLTGYIGISWVNASFDTESGFLGPLLIILVLFQSVIFTFLVGPTVAGLTGLLTGRAVNSAKRAPLIGGAGAFLGFYVMALIAVALMFLAFPESATAGGGNASANASSNPYSARNTMSPLIKAGAPTAVVGAACGYLGTVYDSFRFGN